MPRLGGPGLTRGLVVGYLSIMVLLPIAAVVSRSFEDGWRTFWDSVTTPQAVAAMELTLIASLVVVAINAVFGTIIAWVLVRDEFPGKRYVNAIIDLPFALPTIVAGLTLLALYGDNGILGLSGVSFTKIGIIMALLFVTLPFVVRAVQPVLLELDQEMEEAAASLGAKPLTIFRRIVLPNIAPAMFGRRRARLRASDRRVRLADPDLGQHPVRHRGRVGLHLQAGRGRQRGGRRLGLGRAARRLRRRADPHQFPGQEGRAP